MPTKSATVYGLLAEFDDPNALVAATQKAHHEGYRRMDAYSPFPIEELHEALGGHHTRLPLIVHILTTGDTDESGDTEEEWPQSHGDTEILLAFKNQIFLSSRLGAVTLQRR